MLRIKLSRIGRKGQPSYRIVVNEQRDKRDGAYTAQVGTYVPTGTKALNFDVEAYNSWISKGAQPTQTVEQLFRRFTAQKTA